MSALHGKFDLLLDERGDDLTGRNKCMHSDGSITSSL